MRVDSLIEAAGWWSYLVVFAMTAAETSAFIGLLVPGEAVVLLASAIAGRGDLDPLVLCAVVLAGGMTGDNLGYALGRRCERCPRGRLTRRFRSADGGGIDRARAFLARHGGAAVIAGRFIGFVRTFVPFAAGAAGMPYRRFFAYSTAASLVWGVGNVLLGYFAGAAATEALHSAGLIGAAALAALAVGLLCGVLILKRHHRRSTRTASVVVAFGGTDRAAVQDSMHVSSRLTEE
ncbi:DedA family protein [Streptomyces sp. NPDC002643]